MTIAVDMGRKATKTNKKQTNHLSLSLLDMHNVRVTHIITMQSLYNIVCHNMDLDIMQSCCGSQIFLPWNFTKEL